MQGMHPNVRVVDEGMRRGLTDAGDRTGQDRTQGIRRLTYGNEPKWNCKHKEIIKGANEGNEGEQLGKINQ